MNLTGKILSIRDSHPEKTAAEIAEIVGCHLSLVYAAAAKHGAQFQPSPIIVRGDIDNAIRDAFRRTFGWCPLRDMCPPDSPFWWGNRAIPDPLPAVPVSLNDIVYPE